MNEGVLVSTGVGLTTGLLLLCHETWYKHCAVFCGFPRQDSIFCYYCTALQYDYCTFLAKVSFIGNGHDVLIDSSVVTDVTDCTVHRTSTVL
jgi:hypothetical protein